LQGFSTRIGEEYGNHYLVTSVPLNGKKVNALAVRFSYLSGPLNVHTLFGQITLPPRRYLCIRIPYFYQWRDDLNAFPEIREKANGTLCRDFDREAFSDFYVSYSDCDTLSLRMDIPLETGETVETATPDIMARLIPVLRSVYSEIVEYDRKTSQG